MRSVSFGRVCSSEWLDFERHPQHLSAAVPGIFCFAVPKRVKMPCYQNQSKKNWFVVLRHCYTIPDVCGHTVRRSFLGAFLLRWLGVSRARCLPVPLRSWVLACCCNASTGIRDGVVASHTLPKNASPACMQYFVPAARKEFLVRVAQKKPVV